MQPAPPNDDESLREHILASLAAYDRTVAEGVRVGVLNSIVHLAGSVDTLAVREDVESLVRLMPGIRGVVNRIDAPCAPSPSRTIHLDLSQEKKEED